MRNVSLLVVVHDISNQPVEAKVEYRPAGRGRYRALEFNETLRRFAAEVEPAIYELRVQGPKGTSMEHRRVTLNEGDVHVSVMVAEPGLPALSGPNGNWYFKTRDDERLLHVQGAGALDLAMKVLAEHDLKAEPLTARDQLRADDVLFLVKLSDDNGAKRLAEVARGVLADQGLAARVAVPGYNAEEVGFGLTDEIIIRFRPDVTTAVIARIAKRYELHQLRQIGWLGNGFLFRRPGGASLDVLKLIASLNDLPQVVYAEPNVAQRLENYVYTPADYLYPETPHLPLVNADDAWDTIQTLTTVNRGGSPDVVVAVLDIHGVDPTHAELTGTLSDGSAKQIANYNFVSMANQTLVACPGDHGTQCAGSAVGKIDNTVGTGGIAPNCKLIGGRFSGFSSPVDWGDYWVWMAAGFSTSHPAPAGFPAQPSLGADIISNSFGPTAPMAPIQTLRDAFDFLSTYPRDGRGVIMVFATGNLGYTDVDTFNPLSFDAKTLAIGASINTDPTNPVNSVQPDHQGNLNNLPAVVDTRAYYSPFGLTIDLVSPSHTCYGPGLPGAGIADPVMAPSRTGFGDWPGNPVTATTLSAAVNAGDTVLPVGSSAGFAVGDAVLLDAPGGADVETTDVTAVAPGQLTATAIANAHPAGTAVASGPNDYAMNPSVGFGGTSHSCPTVAGAAALMLSVQPDLNWIEVRDILRATAVQIDSGQADPTGQWVDLDGDSVVDYSQWYGFGRLDVDSAVTTVINLTLRADAVIRDNLADTGAVPSTGWHAASPDIWTRQTDDPIPALAYAAAPPHENPRFGQDNYVYLRVRNSGTATASQIFLRALITHFPGIEFVYPDDWQPTPNFGQAPTLPMQPGTYLIGEETVNNLAPATGTIVKMTWDQNLVPPETVTVGGSSVTWHPCLLAEAAPHDGPAVVSGLTYPVQGDNNLAHRNIAIEYPAAGGSSRLMTAVVAGTRDPSGVEMIVVDRTALPADLDLLVRAVNPELSKRWTTLVRKGRGVTVVDPLGVDRRQEPTTTDAEVLDFDRREGCEIRLLDTARLAVHCCDDTVLLIEAPRGTRMRTVCAGDSKPRVTGLVSAEEVDGGPLLRVKPGAGAIALPARLGPGQWEAISVGVSTPNLSDRLRGQILVSQIRGDGSVSPGYQVDV